MDAVLHQALDVVGAIIAAVLTPLIVQWIANKARLAGLQLSAEKEAQVEKIVRDVILNVEEWAATRVKVGTATNAGQKLDKALIDVVDKVPGISREEAAELIHATLPKVGLGAAAFLQGVRQAATTGDAR